MAKGQNRSKAEIAAEATKKAEAIAQRAKAAAAKARLAQNAAEDAAKAQERSLAILVGLPLIRAEDLSKHEKTVLASILNRHVTDPKHRDKLTAFLPEPETVSEQA